MKSVTITMCADNGSSLKKAGKFTLFFKQAQVRRPDNKEKWWEQCKYECPGATCNLKAVCWFNGGVVSLTADCNAAVPGSNPALPHLTLNSASS
jgi:hypothetical protein